MPKPKIVLDGMQQGGGVQTVDNPVPEVVETHEFVELYSLHAQLLRYRGDEWVENEVALAQLARCVSLLRRENGEV